MESSLYYTIFALLLVLSPILAFAPPTTRISNILSVSSAKINTELYGKLARSPEDDLELTREVIMKHIASTSNDDVVDDGDDEISDSKSGEVETRGTRQKIKALGSKVKSKGNKKMRELKKRFNKNETEE